MLPTSLILLAAGSSTRFDLLCKKQNLYINDEPLWLNLAKRFRNSFTFSKIIIVCEEPIFYEQICADFCYVKGGASRGESIKNALKFIESEYALISDVARAYFSPAVLCEMLEIARKNPEIDCIFPAIKVVDTLFNHAENFYAKREDFSLVQTPQLSKTKALKDANLIDFSDESSAIFANGGKIMQIKGDEFAFKLTHKNDLKKLKILGFAPPCQNQFCGFGYDVHEFCASDVGHKLSEKNKNEFLSLAGVEFDAKFALKAHSDGDVLCHALTDALLGACMLGDIGYAFSPDDERFRKANSLQLLKLAYEKCQNYGFCLVNADITIACEKPKIAEKKWQMQANLAKILNCRNINIKATTTEKLGFIGRGEGIGVYANVNMKLFDWSEE